MWTFDQNVTAEHLRTAFSWYKRTPFFLRANCEYKDGDENEFVETLSKGMNFAGYIDGVFSAMVHGEIRSEQVIEGHLYAARKTDVDFIVAMVTFAKREAHEVYEQVVVEIPQRHKTLHSVILRSGFFDLGLDKIRGIIHGRLFQTQFYYSLRGGI